MRCWPRLGQRERLAAASAFLRIQAVTLIPSRSAAAAMAASSSSLRWTDRTIFFALPSGSGGLPPAMLRE